MLEAVRDLREFADKESETIGRDILGRRLHAFADRITEECDGVVLFHELVAARQKELADVTAAENARLRKVVETMIVNFEDDDDYLAPQMRALIIAEARQALGKDGDHANP